MEDTFATGWAWTAGLARAMQARRETEAFRECVEILGRLPTDEARSRVARAAMILLEGDDGA